MPRADVPREVDRRDGNDLETGVAPDRRHLDRRGVAAGVADDDQAVRRLQDVVAQQGRGVALEQLGLALARVEDDLDGGQSTGPRGGLDRQQLGVAAAEDVDDPVAFDRVGHDPRGGRDRFPVGLPGSR